MTNLINIFLFELSRMFFKKFSIKSFQNYQSFNFDFRTYPVFDDFMAKSPI